MPRGAPHASTSSTRHGNMVSWRDVRIDGSDDEPDDSDEDVSSGGGSWSDEDYIGEGPEDVSDDEENYKPDNDAQEDTLEIPEEFWLAKPQEINVEEEMEGDFNRYFKASFKGDTNQGSWAFDFQEDEFQEDLRGASGVGKRKRGRRPGAISGPRLSEGAGRIFGEAIFAVSGGEFEIAIPKLQEVIRQEPKHQQSWLALAQCYEGLGDLIKALQVEIMAAHISPDADTWRGLAAKSKSRGQTQQALYCYRKVCRLLPMDMNAHWEFAMLQQEAGQFKDALRTFLAILKFSPHNMTVIDEVLPLLSRLKDWKKGIELLQGAFDYFRSKYPHGPPTIPALDENVDPTLQALGVEVPFKDVHIVALADYYLLLQSYEKAILTIRDGARWLQGRRIEMQWEGLPDDREFDVDHHMRRQEGLLSSGPSLPSGLHTLDVNMRHRLARARIKMGDHDEGRMHASIVLREDPVLFSELFSELADAFMEQALFTDAIAIYSILLENDQVTFEVAMQAGSCYQRLGRLGDAQSLFEWVLSVNPDLRNAKMRLAEVYELQGEPAKALELVRGVIEMRKKGSREDRKTQERLKRSTRQKYTSAYKEERRIEREEWERREKARESLVQNVFKNAQQLDSVEAEDQEVVDRWLAEVSILVDDFRECRDLFPSDKWQLARIIRKAKDAEGEREEENMLERLENELGKGRVDEVSHPADILPKGYRGVSFGEWLELIVKYSIFLTSRGQDELANEVIQHVKQSYPFSFNKQYHTTLCITAISIAVYTSNQPRIAQESRELYHTNQFSNEPFRIMSASFESGLRGTDMFVDGNQMKWMTRQDRQWDIASQLGRRQKGAEGLSERAEEKSANGMDSLGWNPSHGKWTFTRGKKGTASSEEEDAGGITAEDPASSRQMNKRIAPSRGDEKIPLPTKPSVVPRVVHGLMLAAGKSSQGALYYYETIYSRQRDDPILNLAMAIAGLGRAMTRKVDNRHYMIAQSAAFLEEYRKSRQPSNLASQEIEYNFGRFFHQLNLGSFAVKHYQRVLALAEQWQEAHPEDEGFAPEAAYNLSLLYVLSGATGLAKQLYRRWLSI